MVEIINILDELKLGEKILNFASRKQIEGVQDEMFSPERAYSIPGREV